MIGLNILAQTVADRERLLRRLGQDVHRSVLVMDEPNFAARIAGALPHLRVVHRATTSGQMDKELDKQFHLKITPEAFLLTYAQIDRRLLVQAMNEPSTDSSIRQLQAWLADLMDKTPADQKLVVGNFSVGNPSEKAIQAGDWDVLLRKLAGSRHYLGLHEYFRQDGTKEPWHVGRFEEWLKRADALKIARPRILITEFGRDVGGGEQDGWRDQGWSAKEYADKCIAAARQYYDQYGIDALVFCYGSGGNNRWQSFNVEGEDAFMDAIAAHNAAQVTAPRPPAPAVPPAPETLGQPAPGYVSRTATNYGVNVRKTPTTTAEIVGLLKVGDVVSFRPKLWSDSGHDWRRLEQPAGWISETVADITPGVPPKPEVLLPVPFRSQSGAEASRFGNDCGVACALMVLNYLWVRAGFGEMLALTVNDMAADSLLPVADRPQTIPAIIALLAKYGIRSTAARPFRRADIIAALDAGQPVISLVRYKYINPAAGKDFGHYVVPVGYSDTGVFVHDPYLGGANLFVPNAQFDLALSELGDAGMPDQSIVINAPAASVVRAEAA